MQRAAAAAASIQVGKPLNRCGCGCSLGECGKSFGNGWGMAFGEEVGRESSAPAGAATSEVQHNRSSYG